MTEQIPAATGIALAASQHVIVDSGTITSYAGNTPQTGDGFARMGVNGVGLTAVTVSVAENIEILQKMNTVAGR